MQDPRAWKVQRLPKLMEKEHFRGNAAFTKIACGLQHTGALTREGELFMWGCNDCGQVNQAKAVLNAFVLLHSYPLRQR